MCCFKTPFKAESTHQSNTTGWISARQGQVNIIMSCLLVIFCCWCFVCLSVFFFFFFFVLHILFCFVFNFYRCYGRPMVVISPRARARSNLSKFYCDGTYFTMAHLDKAERLLGLQVQPTMWSSTGSYVLCLSSSVDKFHQKHQHQLR